MISAKTFQISISLIWIIVMCAGRLLIPSASPDGNEACLVGLLFDSRRSFIQRFISRAFASIAIGLINLGFTAGA